MTMSDPLMASPADAPRRTPMSCPAARNRAPAGSAKRISQAAMVVTPAPRRPDAKAWPASPNPMKHRRGVLRLMGDVLERHAGAPSRCSAQCLRNPACSIKQPKRMPPEVVNAPSLRRAQPVADPGLGQDVVRALWIGFDLLPQVPHIAPQRLRIGEVAPEFLHQEFVGQDLAGMLHQHAQQIVFLGRELDLPLADLDDAPHQVDRQLAETEDRPLALDLQLMAKRGPHAGQKLVHAERLGDIVVGPEIEGLHLGGLVAAARQHDDRHALVLAAQHAQELEALEIWQAEIEDDQVGLAGGELERGLAVGGLEDLIALRAQAHPQQLADRRLVIHHQDAERGGAHAALSTFLTVTGTGSTIVNTAPGRSERFAAVMVPRMASTKPREIARPSPVPART